MDTMHYYGDLGIFFYYTPIVCSFAMAFVLLINRRRTRPQLWLAVIFAMLGIGMVGSFLVDRYFSVNHREIFRPVNFICSTASSVTVLFYYVSLMRPRLMNRRFIGAFCGGWVLFSLLLIAAFVSSARIHPVQDVHKLVNLSSPAVIMGILVGLCVVVFDVWLAYFVIRMYRMHRKFISETYSFAEGITLSWVGITIAMFALMGILDVIWMVNSTSGYKMLFHLFSLAAIGVIFWYGFRQGEIPVPDENGKESALGNEYSAIESGRPVPVPTDEKQRLLKNNLLEYLHSKKPYLNPELSLKDVSLMAGMNQYGLSRFINKEFGVNFYTFINDFRIEHVLHLISLNTGTMNIDTLFAASGFKSRTVFFKYFKEKTGCSPQEYIEKHKKVEKKGGRKKKGETEGIA